MTNGLVTPGSEFIFLSNQKTDSDRVCTDLSIIFWLKNISYIGDINF